MTALIVLAVIVAVLAPFAMCSAMTVWGDPSKSPDWDLLDG